MSRRAVIAAAAATATLLSTGQLAAAAGSDPEPSRPGADHVLFWNNAVLDAFRQVGGTPGPLSRGSAMMNLAIYDAVNSIRAVGKPYRTNVTEAAGRDGAVDSAVDQAAYDALRSAFPAVNFDDDLAAARALPGRGASEADIAFGQQLGATTADAIIKDRANDGSADTTPYTPVLQPGHWRPMPGMAAGGANWGRVRPFALARPSQYRPGLPFGFKTVNELLASKQYVAGVDEVKRLGRADSTERTPEQTAIARYWANDVDGTYKPVGHQVVHALEIFKKYRPNASSQQSARFFALTSMAMADGAIAVWDSKYESSVDLWRPHHAIHLGDTDNNPETPADMTWAPLSTNAAGQHFTPSFPTYVSGHTGIAAAWGAAVRGYFGTDSLSWQAGTDDPYAVGVVRGFTSVNQSVREKADSRIYAGVHFRWDNDAALKLGKQVGNYVAAHSI
jgi:hypothetical protein